MSETCTGSIQPLVYNMCVNLSRGSLPSPAVCQLVKRLWCHVFLPLKMFNSLSAECLAYVKNEFVLNTGCICAAAVSER